MWLDSITNSMDMNQSKLCEIVEDRGACVLQALGLQTDGNDLVTEQQPSTDSINKELISKIYKNLI